MHECETSTQRINHRIHNHTTTHTQHWVLDSNQYTPCELRDAKKQALVIYLRKK